MSFLSFLSRRGLLALCLLLPSALLAADANAQFETLARRAVEAYLRTHPESATALGDHRFDGQLTDYSPEARAAEIKRVRGELADLERIALAQLSPANRTDAQILRVQLQLILFSLEEEKPYEWDPLSYNASLADSIFALIARDFAPADVRLGSAVKRLEAMPRVLQQIRANLKNPPRIHTETAIRQTTGAIELVRTGLDPLRAEAPQHEGPFAAAQMNAIKALEDYRAWLQTEVLPKADGEFRLGAERFRKKLRLTLDSELSPEEILAAAERELAAATKALYATALPLYRQAHPPAKAEQLADQAHVIRTVFNRLAEKHSDDATVLARVKELTADATDFVRRKDLLTLPDAPLEIIELPEFQRGVAVAYCDSPGALEPQGKTFYKVSPTPADWTPERKASFFREYNDYMLHDLTIHEAMPGHYVQLALSNRYRGATLVRAIWGSGTFVEGWAVYSERVMADAGYGGPEVRMQQLKMRVRAIINAILDQKLHMGGLTEREALDLMMKRGFQEEGEAVGKWRRACQSSTQLSTYFVGALEHDEMRAAAEKRHGAAFNLKQYHDAVLSRGSPPVRYLREELGL